MLDVFLTKSNCDYESSLIQFPQFNSCLINKYRTGQIQLNLIKIPR